MIDKTEIRVATLERQVSDMIYTEILNLRDKVERLENAVRTLEKALENKGE